jgi:hypothetical protein
MNGIMEGTINFTEEEKNYILSQPDFSSFICFLANILNPSSETRQLFLDGYVNIISTESAKEVLFEKANNSEHMPFMLLIDLSDYSKLCNDFKRPLYALVSSNDGTSHLGFFEQAFSLEDTVTRIYKRCPYPDNILCLKRGNTLEDVSKQVKKSGFVMPKKIEFLL